jgi:hypothetical protein
MLAKIFAPEVNEEEELQGISRLTSNTTETFAGSAFKALRHNRNKNFT